MRNRNKTKNTLLFLGSASLLTSLPPSPKQHSRTGNGGCSQPIMHCLCCSFLLTLFPCSSVGSHPWETALHELSQYGSFPWVLHELVEHGGQSFSNRLLQRGSPTGSQILPEILLQCGLLSPRVHGSCQEHAPVWALHGVTASFRAHPPALAWGPPWAAAGHLLHCGPPRAARAANEQPVSPWSSSRAAGESLLQRLERLLPLLLH